MAITDLSRIPEKALIEKFIEVCLAQEANNDIDYVREYNKLYKQMEKILKEMQSRPGDARHLLIPLFKHQSWQVRVKAAKNAFALAPVEARQVLEEIYATRVDPYAPDAGGMLVAIDEGWYIPK